MPDEIATAATVLSSTNQTDEPGAFRPSLFDGEAAGG